MMFAMLTPTGLRPCGARHREVRVLSRQTLSGLYLNVTASPQGGVESNGKGTGGPKTTNAIRPDAVASLLSNGEAQMAS